MDPNLNFKKHVKKDKYNMANFTLETDAFPHVLLHVGVKMGSH